MNDAPTADARPTPKKEGLKDLARRVLVPVYKPTRSLVARSILQSIRMNPALFEVWYRTRAWRYMLTRGVKSLDPAAAEDTSTGFFDRVTSYNRSKIWEWHRTRTETLMAVMRCINSIPPHPKVLVIGPRNEAELLLLHLYDFQLADTTGIDIFSYSPKIECQDMHDIKFPDSSFDIVYSAWTLKYSYDIKKACAEIIRVVKPGGLVATGFTHTTYRSDLDGAPIKGGLQELLRLFEPHVDWVYWQESLPIEDSENVTTIFRVRK